MKTRWKLLAGDPGNGARRGIEGVDCCMETTDQFEVEGDVFPDAKGIDKRLVRKSPSGQTGQEVPVLPK